MSNQEKNKGKQVGTRKAYATDGRREQKMMSFRLDADNADYLSTFPNKGRYINDLIARDRLERGGQ